ncbi:MAG: hypothetical protein H6730_07830 [Deltaproteobacteria bacterium]|nr:hypothetical protein [Deltaproteobacteria bacterium]
MPPGPSAARAAGGGGSSGEYVGRDGGGGGGVLVVEGAVLQVAATLDAHGAAGDAADGSGCGQDAAGAGGGGSGGAVWLRARDDLSGAGEVDVQGGAGGAGGQKAGGDGAPGFVRVDAPDAPRVVGEGALFRGPAWRVEDPRLEGPTSLAFTAQPGAMLALSVDGAVQPDLSTADAQGEGEVQVDLPAGLHTLCLALAGGAPQEVAACMRVASL